MIQDRILTSIKDDAFSLLSSVSLTGNVNRWLENRNRLVRIFDIKLICDLLSSIALNYFSEPFLPCINTIAVVKNILPVAPFSLKEAAVETLNEFWPFGFWSTLLSLFVLNLSSLLWSSDLNYLLESLKCNKVLWLSLQYWQFLFDLYAMVIWYGKRQLKYRRTIITNSKRLFTIMSLNWVQIYILCSPEQLLHINNFTE